MVRDCERCLQSPTVEVSRPAATSTDRSRTRPRQGRSPVVRVTSYMGLGPLLLLLYWPGAPGVRGQELPDSEAACLPGLRPVCQCNNTTVTCSSGQLQRIPSYLPYNTTILNLTGNKIQWILTGELSGLERLRTLFLQDNQIAFIQEGALNNLYSLQLLVLSGNRLSNISDNVFQHLPSIQSIDLSNNVLRHVDKRAFVTLPATRDSINIVLSDNSIVCDCEVRALRDWRRYLLVLNASLAPLTLDGLQCRNAGGAQLDSLTDRQLPTCADSKLSVFESSQICFSCQGEGTQEGCDERPTVNCSTPRASCTTSVRVAGGRVTVEKGCGVYEECLLRERDNAHSCLQPQPPGSPAHSLQCTFCCLGQRCNQGDFGGRTVSYQLYVGLRVASAFQSFMLDPTSSAYLHDLLNYTQALTGVLATLEGGYSVRFISYRQDADQTYVTLLVRTSQVSGVTMQGVGANLTRALNVSAYSGVLHQLAVKYIYVGSDMPRAKQCVAEVTNTVLGVVTWPETAAGSTARAVCPDSQDQDDAMASRECAADERGVGRWRPPDLQACGQLDHVTSQTTPSLSDMSNVHIDDSNVNEVLEQLLKLTSEGTRLSPSDVSLTVQTVQRALRVEAALASRPTLTSAVAVLSNLLDAELPVLQQANASSGILGAIDTIGGEGVVTSGQLLLSSSNLVVAAQALDTNGFQGLEVTAVTSSANGTFRDGDITIRRPDENPPPAEGASRLLLPASLMTSAAGATRVAMAVHRTDKAFEIRPRLSDPDLTHDVSMSTGGDVSGSPAYVTRINSYVMAATVVGQRVRDLRDPVTFTLRHDNQNANNARCVYWQEAEARWSAQGCSRVDSLSGQNFTTCQCDHLTNFALLMDVYGHGLELSPTDRKALSIISYVGCGLSLLALLLTLLTYILFNPRGSSQDSGSGESQHRKLRRDNPSKILVNLCLALTFSNIIFLAGMQPYALDSPGGCKAVAALLHLSLLAALCWMMVEAFYMYLALVLVFKTYFTNFILKCSLVGWGVPFVIVAITLGVNRTENYGPLDTGVCWLRGLPFYVAFVAPVCLILLVNFLAFALVLRQIMGLSGRKLNKSDSFSTSQQLRGVVGVAILLGLTWIFAVLAIDQASLAFYYLFAIFNSLQGLWIFLFYCVLKKEARQAWLRMIRCAGPEDRFSAFATSSKAGYSAGLGHHGGVKATHSSTATTSLAAGSKSYNSDSDTALSLGDRDQRRHESPAPRPPLPSPPVASPGQVQLTFTYGEAGRARYTESEVALAPHKGPDAGPYEVGDLDRCQQLRNPDDLPPSSDMSTSSACRLLQQGTSGPPGPDPTTSDPDYRPQHLPPPQQRQGGRAVAMVTPLRSAQDPRVSPRPLNVKPGHAHPEGGEGGEDGARKVSESSPDPESPTEGANPRVSVTDLVLKFNTRL